MLVILSFYFTKFFIIKLPPFIKRYNSNQVKIRLYSVLTFSFFFWGTFLLLILKLVAFHKLKPNRKRHRLILSIHLFGLSLWCEEVEKVENDERLHSYLSNILFIYKKYDRNSTEICCPKHNTCTAIKLNLTT